MCVLGKRLLKDIDINNCTKTVGAPLHQLFCHNDTCDPYYLAHNVSIVQGIKVRHRYIAWNDATYTIWVNLL